jgi:uncharacterized protein with HEPN domain
MNPTAGPVQYLDDMIEMAERVAEFLGGRDAAALAADVQARFAVERAQEIMGEACKQVPAEVKARFPEVPWKLIARNRDKLIHAYATVDPVRLWDTAANHVPAALIQLRAVREALLAEQQPPPPEVPADA